MSHRVLYELILRKAHIKQDINRILEHPMAFKLCRKLSPSAKVRKMTNTGKSFHCFHCACMMFDLYVCAVTLSVLCELMWHPNSPLTICLLSWSSVTAQKRACNTATCVTHRLADFLSRSGGMGNSNFVPTNVGAKAFGRRRRNVQMWALRNLQEMVHDAPSSDFFHHLLYFFLWSLCVWSKKMLKQSNKKKLEKKLTFDKTLSCRISTWNNDDS